MADFIPLSQPDFTDLEVLRAREALLMPGGTPGRWVSRLEQQVAAMCNRQHAVAFASGSAAMACLFEAMGLRRGDEVILSSFGFIAAASSLLRLDLAPVFADIVPTTYTLDTAAVRRAISQRTRAILAPEPFGNPAGIEEIDRIAREHELILIEDASESLGATIGGRPAGSFGRASVVSLQSSKALSCGEGGMVLCDDPLLSQRLMRLRDHGRIAGSESVYECVGYGLRLSDVHAAIGCAQVERSVDILAQRASLAEMFTRRLVECPELSLPDSSADIRPSWCRYVVRLSDRFEQRHRDQIMCQLRKSGIGAAALWPLVCQQEFIARRLTTRPSCPMAHFVSQRTLALPFFPALRQEQVRHICYQLCRQVEAASTP